MPGELRSFTPPAPDILARAVIYEPDRHFQYETAMNQAVGALAPVFAALSEPERISRSTTIRDGEREEDLWRKQLEFSPRFMFQGQEYVVGSRQIVDIEGVTRAIILETAIDHDSVFLGGLYYDPKQTRAPYEVKTRTGLALGGEAKEIAHLAVLVASEAPKQAVSNGHMSGSWYERRLDSSRIDPTIPYFEGIPKSRSDYEGNPQMYELVIDKGERLVAKVSEDSKSWEEDVTGERKLSEHEVAAWKKLGRMLPKYYKLAKYPDLYKRDDMEPKSLSQVMPSS